jgi:glycosyltransferase involved in cell wall biosynthesis
MNASRIVFLLHQFSQTGSPRLSIDIAEGFRAEASVRIVSWEGGPLLDRARALGPTVVLRPDGSGRILPRKVASAGAVQLLAGAGSRARSLRQAASLRSWRPNLVSVSSVEALPMVGMLRLGGVPVVLHVHELGTALAWFERGHAGLIRSVPDRYIAVSHAVGRDLVQVLGVPADAVSVVPPYILSPVPEAPAKPGRAAGKPLVVGGAGKPSWTKGTDLWLLAAREVVNRVGPDAVKFVWVGYRDNQDGLQFRAMISKLGLADLVELVPETDRPYDHFARFDMLAMSSWEESASLVVLESMAMGVPVICFAPTGGPAEEVGDAGIVIPDMSPHAMADAIVDLARSPRKRATLGASGERRARESYGRDAALDAVRTVFDACVKRPG